MAAVSAVLHPQGAGVPGTLTVSIVSHRHGAMVWSLVTQLLDCAEVEQVLVTCNVPEDHPVLPARVALVTNAQPRGFGANHNAAWARSTSDFFCILNPDVELIGNPFTRLLSELKNEDAALVAPMAMNRQGGVEDNFRSFPSFVSLARRVLGRDRPPYVYQRGGPSFSVDWVGGMFMLMPACWFAKISGFDERYFLYYEDVDLCARLHRLGGKILACPEVAIVHDGVRASRRDAQHMRWHLSSMARYLLTHGLPGQSPVKHRLT